MNRNLLLNRRDMLKALGLLGIGSVAAACGPTGAPVPTAAPTEAAAATPEATTAEAAASGEAKPYDGVTLRMLTQAGADYERTSAPGQEFTEETGAKSSLSLRRGKPLMPKVQADLASGSPQFDLFCNDIEFQYTIWPNLEPINDFLANSDYDMEGFFEPIYNYGEGIAGNTGVRFGLPYCTSADQSTTSPASSSPPPRRGWRWCRRAGRLSRPHRGAT